MWLVLLGEIVDILQSELLYHQSEDSFYFTLESLPVTAICSQVVEPSDQCFFSAGNHSNPPAIGAYY